MALVDGLGNLIDFRLLPGQRHDSKGVLPLLEGLSFAAFLGDKAFDNDKRRAELHQRGAKAVIPPRCHRKVAIDSDREMYKWRHLVENFFARIKEFRRIATRYDRTDTSFAATVYLTSTILALR
jgi:transposase